MPELTLPTAADTNALGQRLGQHVRAGDLVVLTGDLGAGKTTLVQGLAAGLGAPGPVVSPTFVIARVYRGGRLPLVHVDAYRLGSSVEVDDLDLDADLADSVTVVEWGAGLVESLSEERLQLALTRGLDEDDETRHAVVSWSGDRWAEIADALSE
ncbi:MAG: tRNA (adenosine(37)-N6)-threonylcarbamoyltransferase complex ATPase subunit type 1 TsaE [Frankiales bacterium]|nr:tRNA (adenosine(37)-N6)-threonylcarbamoyltransferase complex ATPase subunit type 1 TsaE [Frankiales bacterium]